MYLACYDGNEACGYNEFKKFDQTQFRAMRFLLGVHKYDPILGLQCDMGWVYLSVNRYLAMVRYWNRLVEMETLV